MSDSLKTIVQLNSMFAQLDSFGILETVDVQDVVQFPAKYQKTFELTELVKFLPQAIKQECLKECEDEILKVILGINPETGEMDQWTEDDLWNRWEAVDFYREDYC